MEELKKIGEKLKAIESLKQPLKRMSMQGYNENTCDNLIKLCMIYDIPCQPLIDVLNEDNKKQCLIVLMACV